MHVELPAEQWADVIEPDELTDGDRKVAVRKVVYEVDGEARTLKMSQGMDDDVCDALLARIITNWSYQFPLPKDDLKSLDKLSIKAARVLREAIKPHLDIVMGRDEDPT